MRFRHQASLVRAQEGRAHSRGLHHGSRTTASRGCYVGETGQSKQAQGEVSRLGGAERAAIPASGTWLVRGESDRTCRVVAV